MEEAFLWIDVLEGVGVFLIPGVVEVPLLPATWRGGEAFIMAQEIFDKGVVHNTYRTESSKKKTMKKGR